MFDYKTQKTVSCYNEFDIINEPTKKEKANEYIKLSTSSMKSLSNSIGKIFNQEITGLLNYYSQDEIEEMRGLKNLIDCTNYCDFEGYYWCLKTIIETGHILGFKDVDKYTYYLGNRNSAIYNQKDVWQCLSKKGLDIVNAKEFFIEEK